MYCLSDFELNGIQRYLSIIKRCDKDDNESVSLGILYLKEIINTYCPYDEIVERVVDADQLGAFIKNIDKCSISSNNIYFKISYLEAEKQAILKVNCLASVMYATEYIGKSSEETNIFAEELEPTIFHEDVIISKEMPSLIHRKYKIGPLKVLSQIKDEGTKRIVMYKNKIEDLIEGNALMKGYDELYCYDMYSYIVKENGKIIEKKA